MSYCRFWLLLALLAVGEYHAQAISTSALRRQQSVSQSEIQSRGSTVGTASSSRTHRNLHWYDAFVSVYKWFENIGAVTPSPYTQNWT